MPADHDDLVFQLRISAGYLGNRVEAVLVIAGELRIDVHLNGDRDVGLEQAIDAAVVFNRRDYDRNRLHVLALVAEPSQTAAAVNEDGSAGAAVVSAITAGENHCQGMFVRQEL